MKEVLPLVTTWRKSEDTELSEIRRTQNDTTRCRVYEEPKPSSREEEAEGAIRAAGAGGGIREGGRRGRCSPAARHTGHAARDT